MLTYTPRRRTVHAIPLLLNAFYIKMAGNQTEKKQSSWSNEFRSSDSAWQKRKWASACHASILGRLWWGGEPPDPRLLAERKHNCVGCLQRPDGREGIKCITLWSGSPFYSLHFFTNNYHLDCVRLYRWRIVVKFNFPSSHKDTWGHSIS